MSNPNNPLDEFDGYLTHCVIAAFANTNEAEGAEIPLSKKLNMGDDVPNSTGVIVVNDHRPSPAQVQQFNIQYSWASTNNITTLTAGEILIADRNATGFMKFLKDEVVGGLGVSLENLTFVLKVFWVTGALEGSDAEVIDSKEFYFSVPDIRHNTSGAHNFYMMTAISLYNGKVQLPNYGDLYNFTITHHDGNVHNEMPSPSSPGGGIRPRAEEDEKYEPRKDRIDKSKPMLTLDDVFKSLETELQESTNIHKSQLQIWQSIIRDDFIDKLEKDPEQEKDIPITYTIHLEDPYTEYEVDNRNLPFEQPEQNQESPGIRVIPTKSGETIYCLIYRLFSFSKQVGTDAIDGFRPKVVCTWRKEGDGILIDIRIKRVETPRNGEGEDTGPGEGGVSPLEFFYRANSGEMQNVDTTKITGTTSRSTKLDVPERNAGEADGRVSFGGDRENITSERTKDIDFFMSGYSGNRAFISNSKVLGVEYPRELAEYLSSGFTTQYTQGAEMVLTIRGNPDLFSDLMRKPSEVASGSPGEVKHYLQPELLPIYVKFRIFYIKDDDDIEAEGVESIDGEFYHDELFMHLYKIENEMIGGIFRQKLYLTRTDTLI